MSGSETEDTPESSSLDTSQSFASVESDDVEDSYSRASSIETTLEEDEEDSEGNDRRYSRPDKKPSLPLSIYSGGKHLKGSLKSVRSVETTKSAVTVVEEAVDEGAGSRTRQHLSSILDRIKSVVSYCLLAVESIFSHSTAEKESESHHSLQSQKRDSVPSKRTDSVPGKRTDSLPRKETGSDVEEILAYQDAIYWRSDNHTVVFKRNPEQYTVIEIKQDSKLDKGKKTKKTETKKPNIQKATETTPLGTTVYRQPARGICIGSQQIHGSVKVVLDYNQKVAFVQIISPKSEVYATYNVNSIIFLTTCSPLGVAWIGDLYQPPDREPTPGTNRKRRSSGKSVSRSTTEIEAERYWLEWGSRNTQEFSRYSPAKSTDSNESALPRSGIHFDDSTPNESSKSPSSSRAESEERILRRNTVGQSKEDSTSSTKDVSGSSKEELISIDVVNVIFSNPDQVQRLIKIVEKLKTAFSNGVLPGSATFYDSTYRCGSSSDASSTTMEQSSNASSTSVCHGYNSLPTQFYNLQGSPKVSPGVTKQADGEQQSYFSSTESPQRALEPNEACKISSDKNTDTSPEKQNGVQEASPEKQNGVQQATNNVSSISAPNSQAGPGLSNVTGNTFLNQCAHLYQNQVPYCNEQAKNYSLQNRNVAGLGQQQTGVSQNIHNLQYPPVFFSQNPCHFLNTTLPAYTIQNQLQQGYEMRDPSQALFYSCMNSGNFENQISPASGNPLLSPTRNNIPSMYTNQMSSSFGNQMVSGSRNQISSPSGYPIPSIYGKQIPADFENQIPINYGNQMPSTIPNHNFLALGNQTPLSWCKERMRVASNYGRSQLQNRRGRIFGSANPASIRRQWSLKQPKPCNKIRVCLVSEPY